MKVKTEQTIEFIRELYEEPENVIPLHTPVFLGNEKKYLVECIDTTFISSVGRFVNLFEEKICEYTNSKHAVAVSNGTSALHIALVLGGVKKNNEVITQALSFVATANAIRHAQAEPIFIDVEKESMGMSPDSLRTFLENNTIQKNGSCVNKYSEKIISACVPVHIFGHPCKIDIICEICKEHNIVVIEDAAESIGSRYKNKHTGTFGLLGIISFNGNKTISCGGGGVILTNDELLAKKAKHITTTAKVEHPWKYIHDMTAYNYRLTNINAAIGVAQLEKISKIITNKRKVASKYAAFFDSINIKFFLEKDYVISNYWINAILLNSPEERDYFLKKTNHEGIQSRPVWDLLNTLKMYKNNQTSDLTNAKFLQERTINIPSSYNKKLR